MMKETSEYEIREVVYRRQLKLIGDVEKLKFTNDKNENSEMTKT